MQFHNNVFNMGGIEFILQTTLFLSCVYQVFMTEFTQDRKRIGPMNLVMAEHSCLQKFTVSENMIIRTQDSRLLGAKFLNVSDVDNREDCLSLCCSTRFCDVAVFQEKSPFPCYLFDCGPPEDFLCKFSSHSYYTSAMLTINRHQLDLGLWSSQHQHETELSDLRTPVDGLDTNSRHQESDLKVVHSDEGSLPKVVPIITSTSTTSKPLIETPSTVVIHKTQPVRKCSRYQFECHSGECIAIYNACDGIPQCRDASDEGHDLSCPEVDNGDLEQIQLQKGPQNQDSDLSKWNDQAPNRRKYDQDRGGMFKHRGNIGDYGYNSNRYGTAQAPNYHREDGMGYGGNGKGPGYYDYNQRNTPTNKYNSGKQRDMSGDGSSMYSHDYPDYGLVRAPSRDRQSITGTSSLLQQQQNLPMKNLPPQRKLLPQQYPQRQDINPNPLWQGQSPRYGYPADQKDPKEYSGQARDMITINEPIYNANGGPILPRLQTSTLMEEKQMRPYANVEMAQDKLPSHMHSQYTGRQSEIVEPSENKNETPLAVGGSTNANSKSKNTSVAAKAIVTNSKSLTTAAPVDTTSNSKKITNDSNSESPEAMVAHASISRLDVDIKELEREDEMQKSQISGAVFALSLGVCVTAMLLVLVGCRIHGMKRKAHRRRGMKSPLEHDADYLVNGMYL